MTGALAILLDDRLQNWTAVTSQPPSYEAYQEFLRGMENYPALSPDGRWLADVSDESGRNEVYVRTFPGFTSKVQVSQDGGSEPVWARIGRELFYRSGGVAEPWLVAAAVETSGEFRVTGRSRLFNVASYEFATPHANYDVFPDGRSFVMVRQGRPGQSAEIVYLQNLMGLLKEQAR